MAEQGSIYIQSRSIQLMFDQALTIPSETHSFGNDIATQVLEDGSPISDHIIVLQDELEVQIFVSNSVQQESQDVYAALKTIRNERELCTVYTDHEIYYDMAIESVSAPHEAPMVNCMTFTVKFRRIDWTGEVINIYRSEYFASVAGEMQAASNGDFEPAEAVDTTAPEMTDVGEVTPATTTVPDFKAAIFGE